MRLTTARYFTPSGQSIQAKGIEPDILVERVAVVGQIDQSNKISEADLRGALSNPSDKKKAADTDKNQENGDVEDVELEVDVEEDIVDYQLTRAIDLIEGIALYKQASGN